MNFCPTRLKKQESHLYIHHPLTLQEYRDLLELLNTKRIAKVCFNFKQLVSISILNVAALLFFDEYASRFKVDIEIIDVCDSLRDVFIDMRLKHIKLKGSVPCSNDLT